MTIIRCPKCGKPVEVKGFFTLRCQWCQAKFSKPSTEAREDAIMFIMVGVGIFFTGIVAFPDFIKAVNPDAFEKVYPLGLIVGVFMGGAAFFKGVLGLIFPAFFYNSDQHRLHVEMDKTNEKVSVNILSEETADRLRRDNGIHASSQEMSSEKLPLISLKVYRKEGSATVSANGSVQKKVFRPRDPVAAVLSEGAKKVVLDFSGIDQVDSEGVQQILTCLIMAKNARAELVMTNVPPGISAHLRETGVEV